MKHEIINFFKFSLLAAAISISTVGCATHTPGPLTVDCPMPTGHLVDEAFTTAKSTLSNQECRYSFDAVFDSLLKISEGAPNINNKERFSGFLEWSRGKGVISTVQAKERYTKNFSSRFTSLPDSYQTCSHCPNLSTIIDDCRNELQDKDLGLLKVSSDKVTYAKANNDLQNIELILEATCSACSVE